MILEIADFRVHPGQAAAFEEAIRRGIDTVVSRAAGFVRATVHKSIESPERFILQVEWQALEDHTVAFRGGPLFHEWRAIVGPFFAQPPAVEHYTPVA